MSSPEISVTSAMMKVMIARTATPMGRWKVRGGGAAVDRVSPVREMREAGLNPRLPFACVTVPAKRSNPSAARGKGARHAHLQPHGEQTRA